VPRILEVYDIESLANFFSYTGYVPSEDKFYQFIIWRGQNDFEELITHLNRGIYLVGFNNNAYDYPVLHHMINHYEEYQYSSGNDLAMMIYKKSNEIINMEFSTIAEKNRYIPNLDLYKIHHFDNKGRMASLKHLQCSMRMDNVEEMPFHHTHHVQSWDEVELILDYNKNDVISTYQLFLLTTGKTDNELYKGKDKLYLRKDIQKKFGLNCLNFPDVKIGEELLLKLYCDETGTNPYYLRKCGGTPRQQIDLKDCIPNYVKFNTESFKVLCNWIRNKTIYSTSGGLSDIPYDEVGELEKYVYPGSICIRKRKGERPKKVLENLNLRIQDMRLDYGTGGIHGSLCGKFISDNEWCILDIDVGSMYPSFEIHNHLYPEHLGEIFCRILDKNIISVRLAEKIKPKKERDFVIMEGFKLAGNGAYGKSSEPTSFLYDPLYTMQTTIGCQLSISMLIEDILINTPEVLFLQANTDGITIKLKREYLDHCLEVCKNWEHKTGLMLEYNQYKMMCIVNVSTYLAVYENDDIKLKNDFEIDKELHKNPSMRIVPIALKEFFVNNIPIEETIYNHKDILDFCLMTRCNKAFRLLGRGGENGKIVEKELPNTLRYYISNQGIFLFKENLSELTRSSINAGQQVTLFNRKIDKPFDEYNINYKFYIDECNKIIHQILPPITQLTLF